MRYARREKKNVVNNSDKRTEKRKHSRNGFVLPARLFRS